MEAACGFFKDMSIKPASDMAPNILTVISLAFDTVTLSGLPFKGATNIRSDQDFFEHAS
jgi:hypothetical protein